MEIGGGLENVKEKEHYGEDCSSLRGLLSEARIFAIRNCQTAKNMRLFFCIHSWKADQQFICYWNQGYPKLTMVNKMVQYKS